MYSLLRSHARRSLGSHINDHSLKLRQNGSFKRSLYQHLLRFRHRASCPIPRQIATSAAQVREINGDEEVQNGFQLIRNLQEEVEIQHQHEPEQAVVTAFEELPIWQESLDFPKSASETFLDYWKTPETAKPTDLSYWNVLQGEIEGRFPKAVIAQPHAYRAHSNHSPDRALTLLFIFEYYDQISSSHGVSDKALSTLISAVKSKDASESIDRLVDILHFSWILLAEPADLVRRFLVLSNYREDNRLAQLPKWVLLQILRTRSIDRESLMDLIEWLSPDRLRSWKLKGSSGMILAVRLVRHMRRVSDPDFEAVTAIFLSILRQRFEERLIVELSVVTHWCNRFLSLLALPAEGKPFEAVISQQSAQLDLLQFMQEFWMEIHLGREGYRALARLQLMHAKTDSERQWAEAKALTWPPWEERNRMGAIRVPSHYEGKETRALKVLNRMVESGYAPHNTEASMKILAGWDTDKSPTIQASRIMPSMTEPWKAGPELDETVADSQIWSNRIEATRSVREAWMIFCTYVTSTQPKIRPQYVYFAMHKKLKAPKAAPNSDLLPGDGPEVFPDPELARDQVYIPQEIPAVTELVARMVENKVKCNANLLRYFLDQEKFLETGLALIENSSLSSDTREVLSKPHSSSIESVATALDRPDGIRLKKAYIKLLTRPNILKGQTFQQFEALPDADGFEFVRQCLLELNCRDAGPWEAYLFGLTAHLSADSKVYRRIYHRKVLEYMTQTIEHVTRNYRPALSTVRSVMRTALIYEIPIEHLKEFFVAYCHGPCEEITEFNFLSFCRSWKRRLPQDPLFANLIEDVVWILGSQTTPTGLDEILALLTMVHSHKGQIYKLGITFSEDNLAAFRLFLENDWLTRSFGNVHDWQPLNEKIRQQVDCMLHDLAHSPDDEHMLKYLHDNTQRRHLLQTKISKI